MKRQLILGLVLVLLVLISVGAFFFADAYQSRKEQQAAEEEAALQLCTFSSSDVTKLDLHTPELDYTIEKDDTDTWAVTSGNTLHINTYYIEALCTYGSSLTAVEDLGTAEESTLQNYGLSDPVTITYYLADGSEKTIYIGKQTPTSENFYVMQAGSDHVYLVDADTAGYLYVTESQLRYRYVMEDKDSDINEYYLERDGEIIYHMQKDDSDNWVLTAPIDTPLTLDLSRISELSTAMIQLEADDFGDDGITSADYAAYGFDKPGYIFRFTQDNGTTTTLRFAAYDPQVNSYVDCLHEETGEILVFDSSYITFLQNDMEVYLTNAVCKYTIDQVSAVDFRYQGSYNDKTVDIQSHLTIDTENAQYQLDETSIDANSPSLEAFTDFYTAISNLPYESLEPRAEIPERTDASLQLVYTLLDGSTTTLELVPRDDTTYWAVIDGKFTYAVVRQRELSGDNKILEYYTTLTAAVAEAAA